VPASSPTETMLVTKTGKKFEFLIEVEKLPLDESLPGIF